MPKKIKVHKDLNVFGIIWTFFVSYEFYKHNIDISFIGSVAFIWILIKQFIYTELYINDNMKTLFEALATTCNKSDLILNLYTWNLWAL